jgi:hypothetical protein
MAVVKGVKEQVHLPLYDCIEVKPGKQLGGTLTSNLLRFFVDVSGKTKLLTNMQAASLLPHWNTFEARALRVVISDLAPQFSEFPPGFTALVPDVLVIQGKDNQTTPADVNDVDITLSADQLLFLSSRLEHSPSAAITLLRPEQLALKLTTNPVLSAGDIIITRNDLRRAETLFRQGSNGQLLPPGMQIFPNNGHGNVIGNFIYNTVTTFFVGEKIMIQVPTWFFPAGAGPYSEDGGTITHGYPNPQATFRFAEPVVIETQQNFRVEIEIPESEVLKEMQRIYGPLFIWVVLDGYMTRDVQ